MLELIKSCIKHRRIRWTYHVNMRLRERSIPRETILSSFETFEIIEKYPDDKYLPSFLIYAKYQDQVFHIQVAVDSENDCVTIVTAYKPTSDKWKKDFKIRRTK